MMNKLVLVLGLLFSVQCFGESGGYDANAGGYDPSIDVKRDAEKAKELEASLKEMAPSMLKKMDKNDICVAYGKSLRDEKLNEFLSFKEAYKYVNAEAKRRNIKVNQKLVKEANIQIGMSICSMYAAWGIPQDENRSVGSWGSHIQHIYGSTYVYTKNGVVTSWQD